MEKENVLVYVYEQVPRRCRRWMVDLNGACGFHGLLNLDATQSYLFNGNKKAL